jgi:hypothetical protein
MQSDLLLETTYLELKSSILGDQVLRTCTPADIAQEVYALLTCYQILRIATTDAIEATGGVDPDSGCFTVASTPPATCSPRPPTSVLADHSRPPGRRPAPGGRRYG